MYKKITGSPVGTILWLLIVIGIVEFLIMLIPDIHMLSRVPHALLSSLILTILVSPMLYFYITKHKRTEHELRTAQEKLIRSEKLAAIGQLAEGVGHELRNPLTAIKNAVYYIKGEVAKSGLGQEEPRVTQFLEIMDNEINTSNKIINDLLGFSRVGKPAFSPVRIEKVIEDALARVPIPGEH